MFYNYCNTGLAKLLIKSVKAPFAKSLALSQRAFVGFIAECNALTNEKYLYNFIAPCVFLAF
jgi:hypothetical protein